MLLERGFVCDDKGGLFLDEDVVRILGNKMEGNPLKADDCSDLGVLRGHQQVLQKDFLLEQLRNTQLLLGETALEELDHSLVEITQRKEVDILAFDEPVHEEGVIFKQCTLLRAQHGLIHEQG